MNRRLTSPKNQTPKLLTTGRLACKHSYPVKLPSPLCWYWQCNHRSPLTDLRSWGCITVWNHKAVPCMSCWSSAVMLSWKALPSANTGHAQHQLKSVASLQLQRLGFWYWLWARIQIALARPRKSHPTPRRRATETLKTVEVDSDSVHRTKFTKSSTIPVLHRSIHISS